MKYYKLTTISWPYINNGPSIIKMKSLKPYVSLLLLMLLIIVPVSNKDAGAFSKDREITDKIRNGNKEYTGEIEEMEINAELLRKEIGTRQYNRYATSMSHNSDTPQKIYTVQTGSFLTFARAQNEFNAIMESLTKKYCSFLRVEKVGSFYTVRLGRFESYGSAEIFINSVASHMPKAMILKTMFMNERLRSCICH